LTILALYGFEDGRNIIAMADKDDSDFEVFLTISEYRKYQNMQKQLDEEKELHRKEKAAIEEKMRSAEKVSENFKRELSERN
jgi:hypothetical protein